MKKKGKWVIWTGVSGYLKLRRPSQVPGVFHIRFGPTALLAPCS